MDRIIGRLIFENWQKKLVALLAALVIWAFVNQSIIATRTITNIPVRISNLPVNKTIRGLLPNGILDRRMTLTMSGSKTVMEELEQGDLEVLLDVSNAENDENDEWIVTVTKKNLISLNPSIDLTHHITDVDHSKFLIKLSELATAKIPITVTVVDVESPHGYEFLDVWPTELYQTISGPVEDVERLKINGLELIIDLANVRIDDLTELDTSNTPLHEDEVSFLVPNKWKKVAIPFQHYDEEQINDPNAQYLRIDFLKKQLLPFANTVPTRVFYPLKHIDTLNPKTYPFQYNGLLKESEGINVLNFPLYTRNVGHLFLDIIRDNVEIVILAVPKKERETLHWNVEIHDPNQLEDTYVAYLLAGLPEGERTSNTNMAANRERLLRKRFRTYQQRFRFYTSSDQKFVLRNTLSEGFIKVSAPNQDY